MCMETRKTTSAATTIHPIKLIYPTNTNNTPYYSNLLYIIY